MAQLSLVDKKYKPKQSLKGIRERALLDEIEELKEQLEEAVKRGDELYDKVEQFETNSHPDYEVLDSGEYADIKRDEGVLDDLMSLQHDLEVARWRADLGIEYANDEMREIIEQLEMLA